ncbi:hypothetical protein GMDG_03455 [Pseudogymnoascus destructans 20631-21]|uniref:Uncharacterized protein n=1 Tax=Pseudogymnoascus destructans (strain ATCC MYA-4855 / 20631-21) TaxID=658429 RepID=L8G6N9_PSED2|nr:hypothetical protein GMDG_03455 [Pseudogymnoascus destructans 20631-21]
MSKLCRSPRSSSWRGFDVWLNVRLGRKKKLVSLGGCYGRINLTLEMSMEVGFDRYKASSIPALKLGFESILTSSYFLYINFLGVLKWANSHMQPSLHSSSRCSIEEPWRVNSRAQGATREVTPGGGPNG